MNRSHSILRNGNHLLLSAQTYAMDSAVLEGIEVPGQLGKQYSRRVRNDG